MPPKRKKKTKTPSGDHTLAKNAPARSLGDLLADDTVTFHASCWLLALILIGTIWWNRFLPMQDYPQHLFMAVVANTYDDPAFNWPEHFELRNQLGPYRVTHLALRGLCYVMAPESSGKVLATLYVLLVVLLVYRFGMDEPSGTPRWGALLFFPLCLHPMYFYGFINFFISIPVILLALLELKTLITGPPSWKTVAWQVFFQVCLFLLHPYTLLVYIVLAFATVPLLARGRRQVLYGLFAAGFALLLFLGGLAYESTIPASAGLNEVPGLQPDWWPIKWDLSFLAMHFTGLRVVRDPNWWIAGVWIALLTLLLWQYWRNRSNQIFSWWFPAMFGLALAGYFVLPFSIQTDGRYTFFNARMAPIVYFLVVPVVAAIPIGRIAGRMVVVLCLVLTCYYVTVHDRVSKETASFASIFDRVEKNAAVLSLIGSARSLYLDDLYYVNFHHCFPFYYHILKGGGVNPDMFDRRLMPVGYRQGKKPGRPGELKLHNWDAYSDAYDYILVWMVTDAGRQRLMMSSVLAAAEGPWTLYKVKH